MENQDNKPLSYLIHEIQKTYISRVKSETDKFLINPSFRYIFMVLESTNGLTQNEIVNFVHLTKPTISLTLKQMEEEGYISREKNENDNRSNIVRLTSKGRQLDQQIKQIFKMYDEMMESSLNDEELKNLRLYLHKIFMSLRGGN